MADVFAYRTVDTQSGVVSDVARMHAEDSQQLEYPISASLHGDLVLLTSWFAGTVERRDRLSGERLSTLHGFAAPSAAVELGDGRLAVSELGSSSLVVVAADDPEERRVAATDLQGPSELWAGEDARVMLTEALSGNLVEIDVDSGERRVVASGLSQPEGLDRLPDGRFVVAEVGARRLVAVDPETGTSEALADDLPIGLPAPSGLPPSYVPTGVAAGADGSVYFTSDVDNAIYRLPSRD